MIDPSLLWLAVWFLGMWSLLLLGVSGIAVYLAIWTDVNPKADPLTQWLHKYGRALVGTVMVSAILGSSLVIPLVMLWVAFKFAVR